MFKTKVDIASTLGKVNQFIAELKSGIDLHKQRVESINNEIGELYETRDELANEIFQATKLIGTLSGDNN